MVRGKEDEDTGVGFGLGINKAFVFVRGEKIWYGFGSKEFNISIFCSSE